MLKAIHIILRDSVQQPPLNTKTSPSISKTGLAFVLSVLVHGFLFCTFFFNSHDYVEPGTGIVDVELTYSALQSKSAGARKPPAVKIPTEVKKSEPSTVDQFLKNKQPPTSSESESAQNSQDVAKESNAPPADINAGGEDAIAKYGHRITKWPKVLREQKVSYPAQAKINGVQGTVSLKMTIDETGVPKDIEILEGPGQGLNEAAATALRGFLFSPAYIGDSAVPVRIVYKYKFLIRDAR